MKGLNWKAIVLGFLVDWLVTFVLFLVCLAILVIPVIQRNGVEAIDKTPSGINSYLTVVIGFATTVLGSYIASGHRENILWKQCLIYAIFVTVVAVLFRTNVRANMPAVFVVTGIVLNIPAALLGGLWRWRNLSKQGRVLEVLSPLPEVPKQN